MGDERIYLDWAATAPILPQVADAMAPFDDAHNNLAVNANANSLHSEGRRAFALMEDARLGLARCLGARPTELVYTAGATEADNAALIGIALAAREARAKAGKRLDEPRILTTAIEHDAVLQPTRFLASLGFAIDIVQPDRNGFISAERIEEALTPQTVLTSVMLANNEIGSIQPIAAIAKAAHAAGSFMHTDAVQAFGKLPVSLRDLGVDAISVSAHKIGGPKGIGALVLKKGTPFQPYLWGGGQESGMRSGTQNVAGMVGFAVAARAVAGNDAAREREADRLRELRDLLYKRLCAHMQVVQTVACQPGSRSFLPNIVNVCVKGFESETLILRYDRLGVAVSGGSACSSHSLEPSRILTAIGIDRDTALCSLRLSMGMGTTRDDIDRTLTLFDQVLSWR